MRVGQVPASRVSLHVPWSGAWTAECALDLSPPGGVGADLALPSGRTVLRLGASSFPCAVDPAGSGRFADRAVVRLVGGAGGWSKLVPSRAWRNDAGVPSPSVVSATAAEVGESAIDDAPTVQPRGWVREAGPASSVLEGRPWRVDPATGVTHVGVPWPSFSPTADVVRVLSFDPGSMTASCVAEGVVLPGAVLHDDRFGSLTVRDVEQEWSADGARATLRVSVEEPSTGSRLAAVLESFSRHAVRPEALTLYRYRVSSQDAEGRLLLQALKVRGPVPDLVPAEVWTAPGVSAKVRPGTLALVSLAGREPLVVGFESGAQVELTLDAGLVWIGGAGGKPVLTVDDMSALINAVVAGFAAVETKLTSLLPILAGGGAAGGAALSAAAPALLAAAAVKKTMAK